MIAKFIKVRTCMLYEDQEFIRENCLSILNSLKNDFQNYAKDKCNEYKKGSVDTYDLQDFCNAVFLSISSEKLDVSSVHSTLKVMFEDKNFEKYFLSAMFLRLNYIFSREILSSKRNNLYIAILHLFNITNKIYDDLLALYEQKQTINRQKSTLNIQSSSGFSLFENIIDSLVRVKNSSNKVHFLNLYNGVKVECDGSIVNVENERVICKVNLMQILAMKEEGNAYILQDENLAQHLKANIISIDIKNSTVLLGNFSRQAKMPAKDRRFPRVHPNKFTKVTLSSEDGISLIGKLYDISEGGMGVVSSENAGFKNSQIINAKFTLVMPQNSEEFDLNLNFKLVVALNYQGSMRYCFEIVDKNQFGINKIVEFSRQREKETLKELEDKLSLY